MKKHLRNTWWIYWTLLYAIVALSNLFFKLEHTLEYIQMVWVAPMGLWAIYLSWNMHKNKNVKDKE